MNAELNKTGILFGYQLLDSLYNGDEEASIQAVQPFCDWYTAYLAEPDKQLDPTSQDDPLLKFTESMDPDKPVSIRELNALRAPLVSLLSDLVRKLKIRLYLQPGTPSADTLCVQKGIQAVTLKGSYNAIPDIDNDSINIMLVENYDDSDDTSEKIDATITSQELFTRSRFCYPVDGFDYDRLYLSGKLRSLTVGKNNTEIILSGSSYAMVGLRESLMPRPATNLATNAQDPYYAFLSAKTAKKYCSKINTVVIAGGYYFWHTDMSDNPSDYYKSVLTRTNYPVFKDLHHYKGDIPPAILQIQRDPLLETVFDFARICEKDNNRISTRLAFLEYYNAEVNPRPEYGMLRYPFREQGDDVNEKAAQTRAQAHNGNYSLEHLADNMNSLSEFLLQMKKKQVTVIIIIPPATKFYRQFSAPELRASLYEQLAPVRAEYSFEFLDLFDDPLFDVNDFQDYDHLNIQGAGKLSAIISGLV